MLNDPNIALIRTRSRPLEPNPTGIEPRLQKLESVRAVLFDIYGTLVISASGEVGVARQASNQDALGESLHRLEIPCDADRPPRAEEFYDAIEACHRASRAEGIEYPEVNVVQIWDGLLRTWRCDGRLRSNEPIDPIRFAVEYETGANPVWPMPHAAECLQTLRGAGIALGIVSNAQFYTKLLLPALFDKSLEELGFAPDLGIFSYEHGWGKPGLRLYEIAVERLAARGIAPHEAICVGNDMLNDIMPPARLGFRTALFAGDARSLRFREDDPRVGGVEPDLVLSSLDELDGCLIR